MDEVRAEFEVSVKISMYSYDLTQVVIMQYDHGVFGLPGGHLERGETPDEALVRELDEEVGVAIQDFTKVGFYLRNGAKTSVILGYAAIAPEGLTLNSPNPEIENAVWVPKSEVAALDTLSDAYKQHILDNWPTNSPIN